MIFFLAWCAGLIAGWAAPFFHADAASVKEPALNENFYGVEIAGRKAWIVGYYGTILHSPDRGSTWEIQSSPARSALFKARFVNPSTGWIHGSYGTILRTVDGGKSWRPQPSGTGEHLFDSFWLDESRGWLVGGRGVTLRTDDGGRSWRNLSVPGDFTFNAVSFVDRARGWLAGEFGVIFHTRDGGSSWTKQKSPIEVSFASGESRNLFALLFGAPQFAYAFGLDGVILRTADGSRWEVARQASGIGRRTAAHHLFAAARVGGRVWAVGERGAFLRFDDRGDVWRQAASNIPPITLNGIAFGADGFGLIVGNRGLVMRSEDGGSSWQRLKINLTPSSKDKSAP